MTRKQRQILAKMRDEGAELVFGAGAVENLKAISPTANRRCCGKVSASMALFELSANRFININEIADIIYHPQGSRKQNPYNNSPEDTYKVSELYVRLVGESFETINLSSSEADNAWSNFREVSLRDQSRS